MEEEPEVFRPWNAPTPTRGADQIGVSEDVNPMRTVRAAGSEGMAIW